MIARDRLVNVTESSRQLSKTADAEPENRALVLASHRPERQKSKSDRANLELELELIQPHMAQKPMLQGEVGARVRVIRDEREISSSGVLWYLLSRS